MITFSNITNEAHKENLREMLLAHYKEYFGPEWSDKIPVKFIRDHLSSAKGETDRDMGLLFGSRTNNVVFGMYNDEDKIIGLLFLTVHARMMPNNGEDIYGELYHLYVKPEYRKEFINGLKKGEFIKEVNAFMENYFKSHNVSDILSAVPSEIDYLVECAKMLGFEKKKDLPNEIGIQDALWERTI